MTVARGPSLNEQLLRIHSRRGSDWAIKIARGELLVIDGEAERIEEVDR